MNYFILLEVGFDPIDSEEAIKKKIDKKIMEWQRDSKNPRKQIKAKENLLLVDDMKKIMFSSELKQEEAFKAMEIKENKLREIKNNILILSSKGYINSDEFLDLSSKFNKFGYNNSELKSFIEVPILDNIEFIDKNIASQLETYFLELDLEDMSLYRFLNVETVDIKEIESKINDKLNHIIQKGTKDNDDESVQKILGIAKNIFSSKEETEKYDNYITGNRFACINILITNGVEGMNNIMNNQISNVLCGIMMDDYHFDLESANKYLLYNALYNNFSYQVINEPHVEVKPYELNINDIPYIPEISENILDEEQFPEPENIEEPENILSGEQSEFISNSMNHITQVSQEVDSYMQKRYSNPLLYPAKSCNIINIIIASMSTIGMIIIYFLKLTEIKSAIPIVIICIALNVFFIVKNTLQLISWNKMENSFKDIVLNKNKMEELFNNIPDKDHLNNHLNSINKINKENNILCKKWNDGNKFLKVPSNGFNNHKETFVLLGIIAIVIIFLLIKAPTKYMYW